MELKHGRRGRVDGSVNLVIVPQYLSTFYELGKSQHDRFRGDPAAPPAQATIPFCVPEARGRAESFWKYPNRIDWSVQMSWRICKGDQWNLKARGIICCGLACGKFTRWGTPPPA